MSKGEIDVDFLRRWVMETAPWASAGDLTIQPLAGDVSLRRYYRVRRGLEAAVVAYYPPELLATAQRFERTSKLLAAAAVRVPAVRRTDRDAGLMLLEDVGTETLFDWRSRPWEELRPYLELAWEAARRVGAIDPEDLVGLLPPLDAAVLERELAMTWDEYLAPSGLATEDALGRRLRRSMEELCAQLEAGGLVPCHRDLMARNLVPLPSGEVAVLDHQDLRLGPRAYDAASLFNDSLYPPEQTVEAILGSELYRSAAYHRAVVQRCWKIVGTFASFARRGQPRHLSLIPISLERGLEHLGALEEGSALASDLRQRWGFGAAGGGSPPAAVC